MAKVTLEKELSDARYALASVRLSSRVGQHKNTADVKKARKVIARILTQANSK